MKALALSAIRNFYRIEEAFDRNRPFNTIFISLNSHQIVLVPPRASSFVITKKWCSLWNRNGSSHQTNLDLHVYWVSLHISLPSFANQQREMISFHFFWRTLSTTANFSYFWLFGSEVLSAAFSAESRLHTEKHTVKPRHLPWSFLFFFSFLLFFIPWIPRKRINHRHHCLREELNSTPSTLVKENEIYLDLKMSVPNCLFVRFLNLGPERHWSLLQFKDIFLLNF